MYIHGDMTTAKFAVIENPRIYQFKGRWTDYTERFAYAKVFEVTRDFIQDVCTPHGVRVHVETKKPTICCRVQTNSANVIDRQRHFVYMWVSPA